MIKALRHLFVVGTLLAVLPAAGEECAPLAASDLPQGPALATEAQASREILALRLLAHPDMQSALRTVEQLYRSDPQGATAAGAATIRRAADAIAMASVYYAISEATAQEPTLLWVANAPHQWMGLDVPRSGFGIDNPDNVYRQAMLDSGSRYEIHGLVRQPGPVEQHFQLAGSIPGLGPMTAEGAGLLGQLRSDEIAVNEDGSFCISVDARPADGRRNHLQMPQPGKLMLHVRDLFTDWETQRPIWLAIRRVGADLQGSVEAVDDDSLARRAAQILAGIAPYWVDYDNRFVFSRELNQVGTPRLRPAGRGVSASGHFKLPPGKSLLITLDTLGAVSMGIQLTDPWGVAYEYRSRTSSLNVSQARPNADGSYSFVISASDPGVHNWLDSEGFDAGIFAIRWQVLAADPPVENAVREVALVDTATLSGRLPALHSISPQERSRQREQRAHAHDRRLSE
jgi:hypothetical protein